MVWLGWGVDPQQPSIPIPAVCRRPAPTRACWRGQAALVCPCCRQMMSVCPWGDGCGAAVGRRLWSPGARVWGQAAEQPPEAVRPPARRNASAQPALGRAGEGGAGICYQTQPGRHFQPADLGWPRSSQPSRLDPAFLPGVPPAQPPPPASPAPRAPKRFQLLPAAAPFPLPSPGRLP